MICRGPRWERGGPPAGRLFISELFRLRRVGRGDDDGPGGDVFVAAVRFLACPCFPAFLESRPLMMGPSIVVAAGGVRASRERRQC